MLIAFDVLQIGRRDIRSLPLVERRLILEDAIADSEIVLPRAVGSTTSRRIGVLYTVTFRPRPRRSLAPRLHAPIRAGHLYEILIRAASYGSMHGGFMEHGSSTPHLSLVTRALRHWTSTFRRRRGGRLPRATTRTILSTLGIFGLAW